MQIGISNSTNINKMQRLEFVRYWANYVRTHTDKEWSKQQAMLIDSMIEGAQELSRSNPDFQKRWVSHLASLDATKKRAKK